MVWDLVEVRIGSADSRMERIDWLEDWSDKLRCGFG